MAYQLVCNIPPEVDGTCASSSWVPISDLAQMSMADANDLILFTISGFLIALTFRWAIRLLLNRN